MTEKLKEMLTASKRPPTGGKAASIWLWTERLLWATGIAASAFWVFVTGASVNGAQQDLKRFAEQKAALPAVPAPDQRLWSPERIQEWHASVGEEPPPLA